MEDTLALFSVIVFYLGGGSYAPEVGEFTGEQVGGWEIKPTPFRGGSSKLPFRQSYPSVSTALLQGPPSPHGLPFARHFSPYFTLEVDS